MTRKDYEAIAAALREYREDLRREHASTMLGRHKLDTVEDVTEILAEIFAADNPRFLRDRFTQAAR
jgi:hypothetical protein